MEVNKYKILDLNNVGTKDEPWILARKVQQRVFYILDPKDEKKNIIPGKQRILGVEYVTDQDECNQ